MFDHSLFEAGLRVDEFRNHFWIAKEQLEKDPDEQVHAAVFRYKNGSNKLLDEIGPLSAFGVYLRESNLISPEATIHWLNGSGPFDGEIRFEGSSIHIEICKPIQGQSRMFQGEQVLTRGFASVTGINGRAWDEGLPELIMRAIEKKAQRTYDTKRGAQSVVLIYIAVEQIGLGPLLRQRAFANRTLEEFISEKKIPADRVVLMAYNWDASESKIVCLKQ